MARAVGALLLCLLSASLSAAAQAPRENLSPRCDSRGQTTSIRKLIRQARALGGPLAHRTRLATKKHLPHFQQVRSRRTVDGGGDAIQNDAPAAQSAVDPLDAPQMLAAFVDGFEQLPLTLAFSPRSPRGPPPHP